MLHCEAVTEIEFAADGVIDEEIPRSLAQDLAFIDKIGTVDELKSLTGVVVGNEDGETRLAQVFDNVLDLVNGDGINAGERFVEHEKARGGDEGQYQYQL